MRIVVLVFLATSAAAQPLQLTLRDAVHRALTTGTQAELARSAEERARIAKREALDNLLPQADARLMRSSQSINLATFGFSLPGFPQVVGPFNVDDAQISAVMQVFNLAAVRRYRAFQEASTASRYEAEQAENDIAAAVTRLYLMTQRAEAQAAARQADVTLFERLVKLAEDELEAGTGTKLDVAQARVQLARTRQALLSAQNDRRTTTIALLNAIGAPEADDIVLADPLSTTTTPPPALDAALSTAREQRPELRAAVAREREAQLNVGAAEARRLPSLVADFVGDYSGNRLDDLRWTRRITGALAVPIFRGDVNSMIARAHLLLHEAQLQRTQRERDVEQDVRRSVLNVENANGRLEVARENVAVAEEALTIARDRRSAGYGSPVEVDRAQDTVRQAHEDLIAAEADAAAAGADLEHATGVILSRADGEGPLRHPAASREVLRSAQDDKQ